MKLQALTRLQLGTCEDAGVWMVRQASWVATNAHLLAPIRALASERVRLRDSE